MFAFLVCFPLPFSTYEFGYQGVLVGANLFFGTWLAFVFPCLESYTAVAGFVQFDPVFPDHLVEGFHGGFLSLIYLYYIFCDTLANQCVNPTKPETQHPHQTTRNPTTQPNEKRHDQPQHQ